jgi:NAD(P)-dependent dehydrogenase (short-subunit alcohol dehydrogenase family)
LISGVLTDEYTAGGVIGTVINHIVEGFVKAAAVELPRGVRINCISPTVLTESVAYHPYLPGFIPVDAWEVGQAYLRAISNPIKRSSGATDYIRRGYLQGSGSPQHGCFRRVAA